MLEYIHSSHYSASGDNLSSIESIVNDRENEKYIDERSSISELLQSQR